MRFTNGAMDIMLLLCSLISLVACQYQPVLTGSFVNGQPQWRLTLPTKPIFMKVISFSATPSGANSELLAFQSATASTGGYNWVSNFRLSVIPNQIAGAYTSPTTFYYTNDLVISLFGHTTGGQYWTVAATMSLTLGNSPDVPQVFNLEYTVYSPDYIFPSSSTGTSSSSSPSLVSSSSSTGSSSGSSSSSEVSSSSSSSEVSFSVSVVSSSSSAGSSSGSSSSSEVSSSSSSVSSLSSEVSSSSSSSLMSSSHSEDLSSSSSAEVTSSSFIESSSSAELSSASSEISSYSTSSSAQSTTSSEVSSTTSSQESSVILSSSTSSVSSSDVPVLAGVVVAGNPVWTLTIPGSIGEVESISLEASRGGIDPTTFEYSFANAIIDQTSSTQADISLTSLEVDLTFIPTVEEPLTSADIFSVVFGGSVTTGKSWTAHVYVMIQVADDGKHSKRQVIEFDLDYTITAADSSSSSESSVSSVLSASSTSSSLGAYTGISSFQPSSISTSRDWNSTTNSATGSVAETSIPITLTSTSTSTTATSTVITTQKSTTVVVVTACSANKCAPTSVTTGVTVVTATNNGVVSSYTTYCPLSSEAVITAAATVKPTGTTKISGTTGSSEVVQKTTVFTITSCNDIVCSKFPVTQTVTKSVVVGTFATSGLTHATASVTQPTTTLLVSSTTAVSTFEGAAVRMAASTIGSVAVIFFFF